MTRQEFIEAATKKYGDRYDYSGVTEDMVKNNAMAPIICHIHGLFWETPQEHLHGIIHCLDCYKENVIL